MLASRDDMLRRAAAHPRQAVREAAVRTELQVERAALLRFIVSRPGALAEGVALPGSLDSLDTGRLLEALASGEPLEADALDALLDGPPSAAAAAVPVGGAAGGGEPGVESVAAAVEAGGLPGHDLDAAAYEAAVLHYGAADAEQHPAERQYLCQSIRHAAGLSRREVAHSEALARGAAQLERDFDDDDVPARGSLEYRLFLCRCAAALLACRRRRPRVT